ncbi:MAG: hypothetical protein Q8R00_03260 [Candidatus Nanoarchaeia archaeon]|nr:hypothetical protein [Candidatus Nanoarchaeia archaeon]
MRNLPLFLATFLILLAGFISSVVVEGLTGESIYDTGSLHYRVVGYRSTADAPGTIPVERFDFNKDGVVNKDDVRDHNNVLRRCLDALWSPHCIPELDIDGNGRYEHIDNRILYEWELNPTISGQNEDDSVRQRTDDCSRGALKCVGDRRYQLCGNYDGDRYMEWSDPMFVTEKVTERGIDCRYGKLVTKHFNPDY